ncbi:hypothetical protein GGTG_01107 [Gaeumannomyces tritici R3-111a-1]|uniref:Uncharacterized protein n=1 Tax=Gaeumannomyces tritici (strain R3-111a-1) TaxID=644352 RepID=J3NIM9_GAET3|nr:hypothetical protein GGTG_01107 [Gaeumannomyces tritici R3-111a-1]EJT81122.1 hypothetical protein GGTG_01107 [Gaeumannomyces tritici R3-111a-1]
MLNNSNGFFNANNNNGGNARVNANYLLCHYILAAIPVIRRHVPGGSVPG